MTYEGISVDALRPLVAGMQIGDHREIPIPVNDHRDLWLTAARSRLQYIARHRGERYKTFVSPLTRGKLTVMRIA